MQTIRNTFVVMEAQQSDALLLDRATLIARATSSHLHLLVCDKNNQSLSNLQATEDALRQKGFSVSSQQAWQGRLHKTIIAVQQEQECGLVIKRHVPDNPLLKTFLPSEDWKLLRFCPCPVLIVKSTKSWDGGVILAAIDAGNNDVNHRVLHAGIVGHGYDIARMIGGSLHIMSAHPCTEQLSADPVYHLRSSIYAMYHEHCRALQAEYEVGEDCLHIEEGPAESLIPSIAGRLDVSLTVIGSVARSGLSGALLGNTAENILDSLSSDVLVLKPDDIINHLEELASPPHSQVLDEAIHSWPYSHTEHLEVPAPPAVSYINEAPRRDAEGATSHIEHEQRLKRQAH
jgi:nucleotide-binding universal stress UspA family protein